MRLISQSLDRLSAGSITLYPEDPEDMWHAYNLLSPGDQLRASALRRVTTTSATGSTSSTRVHTTLLITISSTDFDTQASTLHVSGRIAQETTHAKLGQYHTLDLELRRNFTVIKEEWDSVARGVVTEACDPALAGKDGGGVAWAVVMSEGVANICVLSSGRTVLKQRVEVSVPRKRKAGNDHDKGIERFYRTTMETLLRQVGPDLSEGRGGGPPVLLASPGFVAQGFLAFMMAEAARTGDKSVLGARGNFLVTHASSGHVHALNEVLRSTEVVSRLKDTAFAKETRYMDEFMTLLRRDDGRAWYGPREVEDAVEKGAVGRGGGVLLISNALFRAQDVAVRKRWVRLVDRVREVEGGEVRVLSSEHESGRRLDALGGVAAILTFPLDEIGEEEEEEEEADEKEEG
ncbi:Translation factor pelota [Loxospora ochrophaea]|nr:Translation factor pelota [Loxospora ochrophaea]